MPARQRHLTNEPTLPEDVGLRALQCHRDRRGDLTELFRNNWQPTPVPVQWNLLRSYPNSLRGVHVHAKHWDYVCAIAGRLEVGLHDLRGAAPHDVMLHLEADHPQVLSIPPGVAHGFYSRDATVILIGASGYHDPADHLRCRWDCPELGFDWPCTAPTLSDEDAHAGSYAALRADLRAALAGARSMARVP